MHVIKRATPVDTRYEGGCRPSVHQRLFIRSWARGSMV